MTNDKTTHAAREKTPASWEGGQHRGMLPRHEVDLLVHQLGLPLVGMAVGGLLLAADPTHHSVLPFGHLLDTILRWMEFMGVVAALGLSALTLLWWDSRPQALEEPKAIDGRPPREKSLPSAPRISHRLAMSLIVGGALLGFVVAMVLDS